MASDVRDIQITPEAVKKYKKSSLSDALLQPLFNSVDADARKVVVSAHNEKDVQMDLFNDDTESPASIVIEDDGTGIPFDRIDEMFQQFEKSWKEGRKPTSRASYHGCKGCGRFKCFALGRRLEWYTTYRNASNELKTYSMVLSEDNPTKLMVNPESPASGATGTTLKISALTQRLVSQFYENGIKKLMFEVLNAMILDLELTPKVEVELFGEKLNTADHKDVDTNFDFEFGGPNGQVAKGMMRLISWKPDVQFVDHKHAFLYKSDGTFLAQAASGTPADSRFPPHTLIISTDAYDKYSDLEAEFKSWYNSIEKATEARVIAILTKAKQKEFSKTLNSLIQSSQYPFKHPPTNATEAAQQTAYNAVLASIAFDNSAAITPRKPQILKVVMPLLQRVLGGDYMLCESVDKILELDDADSKKFNRMVTRIRLSKLLNRYAELIRRKAFLQTLNQLVHIDEHSKYLRERTQLHKIVAEEVWIFGEEYEQENLLTSDKAITTLIRNNVKRSDLKFETDEDQTSIEEIDAFIRDNAQNWDSCIHKIPDLVLCRLQQSAGAKTKRYLVIELKKPTVKIDDKCRNQALEVYQGVSFAAKNGGGLQIDGEHQWYYYLVSSEMDDSLRSDFTSRGFLVEKESGNYVVGVKLWKEIIEDANGRLEKELNGIEVEIGQEDCQRLLDSYKERFNVV